MTGSGDIWVGELNRDAGAEAAMPGRVGLYDTTLRDGEQTVGVVLDPEAKLEIARALDGLGVERIEGGFPRVSDDDRMALERIAAAGLRAEVWGFSRAVHADVELLVELGLQATVIEAPVSDGKLAAYGFDRDELLRRIDAAIVFARAEGMRVAFFGVDGTRADFRFLSQVYRAAVDAGATEVACVDTLGIAGPEAAAHFVGQTREWVGGDVPIHWHGHDDFGLATATAIAAVRAGAGWVQGTINGMGERAGNTDLIEFALASRALYGVEVNLDLSRARSVSALVQELSGYALEPWKAAVGENLFIRESGAVASQFHDPPAVEPFASSLVGAERGIVLGKKSGIDSIRVKLAELNLDVAPDAHPDLLAQVKRRSAETRRLVSDDEFRDLALAEGERWPS